MNAVCAYYYELHDLFHKDATINPATLCSNRQGHTRNQPMGETNYCETSKSTTDADDIPWNEEEKGSNTSSGISNLELELVVALWIVQVKQLFDFVSVLFVGESMYSESTEHIYFDL